MAINIHKIAEGWAKTQPSMDDKSHAEKVEAFLKAQKNGEVNLSSNENVVKHLQNKAKSDKIKSEEIKNDKVDDRVKSGIDENIQLGRESSGEDGVLQGRDSGGGERRDFTKTSGAGNRYESALRDCGITPIKMDKTNADNFYNSFSEAIKANSHAAFVEVHSKSDYEKMQTFISDDNKSGIAVKADGNIVSVFNSSETNKGVLKTMIPLAIESGGNKLDNYDGFLSIQYAKYGFEPVSKVKFNREYAPSNWNYERDGEPDIIFWKHNGDDVQNVVKNIGKYPKPDMSKVKLFNSYDDAESYRDNLLNKPKQDK